MSFRNNDDFDSASYVKVNERLDAFWVKYPDGCIEIDTNIQEGRLIVEVRLYRNDAAIRPLSTGHSFLNELEGDKVGEYTETVAVGRALANAGFLVEKSIASKEEMIRFEENKKSRSSGTRFKRKTDVQDTASSSPLPPPEEVVSNSVEESKEALNASTPPARLKASARFSREKLVRRT